MNKLDRRSVFRGSLGLATVGAAARPGIGIARSFLPEENADDANANILIYSGALFGQGTGNAVNGANVPFVNGTAQLEIDISQSTVIAKFRADVFVAEFNRFMQDWLDVVGKGTFSPASGTYVFNSFIGQFNGQAIGSQNPFGGPFFTVVLGRGSTAGSSDQLTVGTLQGHDHNAISGDTFTASYALVSGIADT